ncbi:uncharacterized protein BDZ99DRAFT_147595 [Mytilinidion resinicola]|uniref:Uncharacterized protein n=1 Tax=Mytilinidion resinicola TaxID=574789 RepID=A0A6A6Y7I1_9PEZI|nr:uncharacterized protein BDZ99DRAFT_147595 [Mytilinidion resinicola]KAF2804559.1 hypothetical protein BDZ99DRAFT_147595 [Mytilinidion resinicola]
MPPKKRARFNQDTVYAHGTVLRQKKFPSRRTKKRILSPSPPPPASRQQTMTQAGWITTAPPSGKKKQRVEQVEDSQSEPESGSEIEGEDYLSVLRQATLTQLGHGVQPLPRNEGGNRKSAVRRRSRQELTEEEKRQQTLTQMIGTGREPDVRSDVEEEQEELDGTYAVAMEERLANSGLYRPVGERQTRRTARDAAPSGKGHSNGRTLRPRRGHKETSHGQLVDSASTPRLTRVNSKPRSTPRTRRPLEIPSSQSPPESPLSTQNTPQRSTRSPLEEKSTNIQQPSLLHSRLRPGDAERLSPVKPISRKGGLQVKENLISSPVAPPRRIFKDTIPDTDDEEEESDEDNTVPTNAGVGEETEAAIQQIDLMCASRDSIHEIENVETARSNRASATPTLQETEGLPVPANPGVYDRTIKQEPSQFEESQCTIGTGTEEATAQLHSELQTFTQRISVQPSYSQIPAPEEQPEQRIPSSYPLPTQSTHPSQASTIEGTQASPHDAQHSHHTLPISPTRPPPLSIPSSIPTSPFKIFRVPRSQAHYSRRTTGATTAGLTMQDSLDDYSIPLPPQWEEDD